MMGKGHFQKYFSKGGRGGVSDGFLSLPGGEEGDKSITRQDSIFLFKEMKHGRKGNSQYFGL